MRRKTAAMKPSSKTGKSTMERDQGKPKGRASGINKPMIKESIPQVVARNTIGMPTRTQKM